MYWKPQGNFNDGFKSSTVSSGESADILLVPAIGKKRLSSSVSGLDLANDRIYDTTLERRNELLYAVESHDTVILIDGTRDSSQIIQILHEANWSKNGFRIIAMTQPSRSSVVSQSSSYAQSRGMELGDRVGYKVRFETKISSRNYNQARNNADILFMTDAVMIHEILQDPLLSQYSVVFVDQFQQRSQSSEVLLALLRRIQIARKTNSLTEKVEDRCYSSLRVIVSAAAIDVVLVKNFFESCGSGTALSTATLDVMDRSPNLAELFYLATPCRDYIATIVSTVQAIQSRGAGGDILVFLPSKEHIVSAQEKLSRFLEDRGENGAGGDLLILQLHSSLPYDLQLKVFEATPPDMRKVVLSTSIAERGMVIPSIKYVIDSCLCCTNYHDTSHYSCIDYLNVTEASKQSATLRAAVVSTCPFGKVYRLCTEEFFNTLPNASVPEIGRLELTWIILQVLAVGVTNIASFEFVTSPNPRSLANALEVLFSLNAIDYQGSITAHGLSIARLGTNPRLAKALLLSLNEGCSQEMLSVAAMGHLESPFKYARKSRKNQADRSGKVETGWVDLSGDHLTALKIFTRFCDLPEGGRRSWCDEQEFNFAILHRAMRLRESLSSALSAVAVSSLNDSGDSLHLTSCGDDTQLVLRCLVGGFFTNVAKLHSDGTYRSLPEAPLTSSVSNTPSSGSRLELHPSCILSKYATSQAELIVYQEAEGVITNTGGESGPSLSGRGMEFLVRLSGVSKIPAAWLLQMAPHFYKAK